MVRAAARSVSRQVREWLGQGAAGGRVLGVYPRACNLIAGRDAAIALVAPEIGDGPLNVVLGEDGPRFLSRVQPGARVECAPDRLRFDAGGVGLEVDLQGAETWEPCPDWEELRERRAAIEASLELLIALCLEHGPGNPLVSLLGAPSFAQGRAAILAERLGRAAGRVEAGWGGDEGALAEGGAALAGLGEGLTPAGDDFLAGVMLWAWLAHPAPELFCHALCEAAAPRTTALSAAYLRAAARGQCGAAWHRLLAALAAGGGRGIGEAAREVLAQGASSGLDALIGFLYLAKR